MKKLLFGILALCLAASAGYGEEQASPLQLTIQSDKPVYEAGEEMVLKIAMTNEGNKPVSIPEIGNMAWLQGGMIEINGPKGQYSHKGPMKSMPFVANHFIPLASKKTTDGMINLESFIMNDVGEYSITCRPSFYEPIDQAAKEPPKYLGRVTSNTITIEVKEKAQPLQLTIQSDKPVYEAGEEINIEAKVRNNSPESVPLVFSSAWYEYESKLLDKDGNEVPLTAQGKQGREARRTGVFMYYKYFIKNILPAEERPLEPIVLTEWYQIPGANTYYLTIYRRIKEGNMYSLASNTLTLEIVEKKSAAPASPQSGPLTVARVIDGATFALSDGQTVSLIGIEIPQEAEQAKEAAEFTRKLVEGKQVRLEFDVQKKDKYGRTLAYVYVRRSTLAKDVNLREAVRYFVSDEKEMMEVFVNAQIIEMGYAQVMTVSPNVKHAELFVKLEKEAREQKRGQWK